MRLVKRLSSMHADAKGITSSMGETVAKAVENQHFDRAALGMARKLYAMAQSNPAKLAITLPHLLAYVDDLGLAELAAQNQGMNMGPDDPEDEGDEETGDEAGDDTPAEQPATGKSPGLSVVRGAAAPSEVPPAPKAEEAA